MKASSLLQRILRDVALGHGEAVYTSAEVSEWPRDIVKTLRTAAVLRPAEPAVTVICPGCEENCPMPVEVIAGHSGRVARAFVACDKREDIGRVPIPLIDLERHAVCGRDLACAVAGLLGFEEPFAIKSGKPAWRLGRIKSTNHRADAFLAIDDIVHIDVGGPPIPLADVLDYQDGALTVDLEYIAAIVDRGPQAETQMQRAPSTSRREERSRETLERYKTWGRLYREMRKKKPRPSDSWCARQIEKLPEGDGRSFETIRRKMKA